MTASAAAGGGVAAVPGGRIWELPLWRALLPLGRDPATGGYWRHSFTEADKACRNWFGAAAAQRGLPAHHDRNGNLWAWWDPPDASQPAGQRPAARQGPAVGPGASAGRHRAGAIVTGSHLDSVPCGGGFDGPLGVASAFAAVDLLREQRRLPVRPVGIVAFAEEEGARFGVACLGSRLMTGALSAQAARDLTDADGITVEQAMSAAGLDPDAIGPDPDLLDGIAAFVELHIEQGSSLDQMGAAVGIAQSIWPHGRWRLSFTGRADHAGTTRLTDRRDPMLPAAATVLAARHAAAAHDGLATFGKITADPGAVNAISSRVDAWLDARAPDQSALDRLVSGVIAAAQGAGTEHGVRVGIERESFSPVVEFDRGLRDRLSRALAARGIAAPVLPTGAGHDAGVLAGRLPTAMLFVRNPSGVSHAPAEHAEPGDCDIGVRALAGVLDELACR